jgi:hypothetical protein
VSGLGSGWGLAFFDRVSLEWRIGGVAGRKLKIRSNSPPAAAPLKGALRGFAMNRAVTCLLFTRFRRVCRGVIPLIARNHLSMSALACYQQSIQK